MPIIIRPREEEITRFINSGVARIPLGGLELDEIDGSVVDLRELHREAIEALSYQERWHHEREGETKFSAPAYAWKIGEMNNFSDRTTRIYVASLRINPEINLPTRGEIKELSLTKELVGLQIIFGELKRGAGGYEWAISPVYRVPATKG